MADTATTFSFTSTEITPSAETSITPILTPGTTLSSETIIGTSTEPATSSVATVPAPEVSSNDIASESITPSTSEAVITPSTDVSLTPPTSESIATSAVVEPSSTVNTIVSELSTQSASFSETATTKASAVPETSSTSEPLIATSAVPETSSTSEPLIATSAVVSTATVEPSATEITEPIATTPPPITSASSLPGALSQSPTTVSSNWLPTGLIIQQSTDSATVTDSEETGIATATAGPGQTSGLPRAITPATTSTPDSSYQLVYIGFKSALNYPFVVEHSLSSAQIFQYLPGVLSFPFSDTAKYKDVSVKQLVPSTADGVAYTITVAEVYFPSDSVDVLSQFIQTAGSKLYRNSDSTENSLASLIDSRIPITGLSQSDSSSTGDSASNQSNNGSLDSKNASIKNKGAIAGITIGAAAGCGLYLSLMVLLFKRFKKKGIELPPSDSESNFGEETHSGISELFSRDNSSGEAGNGRSVQISDPVNPSNSLGWTS
ncbi:Msb2 [[Candida] zeylanoides]